MPRPAQPGQADDRDEERQRKLAALRARLHEDALTLHTPADWARCLRLAALMPEQEFANILLITAQRPGATMVRDYWQWAATGRQVRRGEKGIEVFAIPPRPEQPNKEETGHHTQEPGWRDADRIAYLWDLPQTTGPPLAVRTGLPPPGNAPTGLLDALRWLARREGFAVEHEHGAPPDGTNFWTARRIRLPPGLSDDQAVWALAHQLGHILLNHGSGLPPGTTTSDCTGLRKAEADSIAYIVTARHGITAPAELAHPAAWAGRDPRAQPAATLLTTGQRITTAATRITRHTHRLLHGDDPAPAIPAPAQPATLTAQPSPARRRTASTPSPAIKHPAVTGPPTQPPAPTRRILQHAQDFYTAQLGSSWAPGYLNSRGISPAVTAGWHIGYAPPGWTALTDHLRRLGHGDDDIEAAGLARLSSRDTLIDQFRDRVMLPVHDEHGTLAGFIGRAHPGAGHDVPKYLNSPETAGYKKGSLLFGLDHARQALAQGAIPVIVEGPFDAIAVTLADPGLHAGLAPCGTALTSQHADLLSHATDLPRTGILVAFDTDPAGRKAAIRVYGILQSHTRKLLSAQLDAKDPAQIFQQDGPAALRAILREHHEPLSALVIDAHIERWQRYLSDTEGPYRAMCSTASLIAQLLPGQTTAQISQLTQGHDMVLPGDMPVPAGNPQLPRMAPASCPPMPPTRSCGPPGHSASTSATYSPKSPAPPPAAPAPHKATAALSTTIPAPPAMTAIPQHPYSLLATASRTRPRSRAQAPRRQHRCPARDHPPVGHGRRGMPSSFVRVRVQPIFAHAPGRPPLPLRLAGRWLWAAQIAVAACSLPSEGRPDGRATRKE